MELTPAIIINATEEVFSSFMLLSMTPGLPYYRTKALEGDCIAGSIYFSGCATGYAAIYLLKETAELVARDFLFEEDLEITAAVIDDIICELTNILAGRVKSYIDPPGSNLHLSLPELSRGSAFSPAPLPDGKKITVPFYLDDGQFWVEVQLA
jgi:chemotaxis protein CheX